LIGFFQGFLSTYIVPLAFVLLVTIGKEAHDDWKRHQRDVVANSARYTILDPQSGPVLPNSHHVSTAPPPLTKTVPSSKLRVGDFVILEKNQRVPADCVLLHASDRSGTCFVRTDQLDGETDWKLRVAIEATQALENDAELLQLDAEIYADPPSKDIHTFVGTFRGQSTGGDTESLTPRSPIDGHDLVAPLTAENMLWANTVLAAGQAIGFIVYTGPETRAVMNTSHPATKMGLLDVEINKLAKASTPCHIVPSVSGAYGAIAGI
jgi:phospholipid-translocating ATPase